MTRFSAVFLLILCCRLPLEAQSPEQSAENDKLPATVVVPTPPAEPSDTALSGKPMIDRAIGGAVAGAVTGAVLSGSDSECAPSQTTAQASIIGGVWGAVRAALGWGRPSELPLPDGDDAQGQPGPYPFDGKNCDNVNHD